MPLHNTEIADDFQLMADLLAIKGANQFRIRAYRNAAALVSELSDDLVDLVEAGKDLTEFDGIGDDLAAKIEEKVATGQMEELEELKQEVPTSVTEMLEIPGLGPERVKKIYNELDIIDREELEKAARSGKIQELSGFGQKTEEKILAGIQAIKEEGNSGRILLSRAAEIVDPLLDYLRNCPEIDRVEVAGSYRRRKETVGDLDFIASSSKGEEAIQYFIDYEDIQEVISSGETRSSVVLNAGVQVDLRAVEADSYGSALQYLTGSKEHSVKLRKMGQNDGLKINEYGVFRNGEKIGGKEEADIYEALGLPYLEPELREKRGELDVESADELPTLVELTDIKGDLQMHTTRTDGRNTLEEMVQAAIAKGYEYIAITDHSQRVSMANGLDEERLLEQIAEIDEMNAKYDEIEILKAIEVDILKDGSLDLPDDLLEQLDVRVCSIHYNMNLPEDQQTERMIKAIEHPLCDIIAHPTGRILGQRRPYDLNLDQVMEAARKHDCILEINAQPDRLDLSDKYVKKAVEMGIKLVISTDAHSTSGLDNMKYGIGQARRGWCEASDIINTQSLSQLKQILNISRQ